MMEEGAKSLNPLRMTVTRVCQSVYSLPTVRNTCRLMWLLATGLKPALVQLGLSRKGPQQPRVVDDGGQIEPYVFRAAVLKGLNTSNKWAV
ncbi:hypothetical protein AVEN_234295-1 [Araneus ventricosus]|uniref:Uncharacterized protein n=1 Tax=Araneus ventricosus TaxID=182803 RepID=A0A4Y2A9Q1_ARAVE|nr:hypothetical protein AVEN_234295-1 [Araneus ventricosus]